MADESATDIKPVRFAHSINTKVSQTNHTKCFGFVLDIVWKNLRRNCRMYHK